MHNLHRNALAPQQDARVPFSQGIVRNLFYIQLLCFLMLYDSAMETMITERAIATIDVCLGWGRVSPYLGSSMPSVDRNGR